MTARPYRQLLRSELVLFGRSAGAVIWTVAVPVIALVVLGNIPALSEPAKELHGQSYLAAYLPILMIFSLCISTVNLLPPTLSLYREKGVLRRLATTPVGPARLLAAQATIYLGLALLVALVLYALGVGVFGVGTPRQLAGFVVAIVLVGAACTGIGLLISALARTGKGANAASMAVFFPLMFLAGLWLPRAEMPELLHRVGDLSPLGAGVDAVQRSIAGQFPTAGALLVLTAYALVCGLVAARTFRWE
jgi:ABC-2 type transport system permease protein